MYMPISRWFNFFSIACFRFLVKKFEVLKAAGSLTILLVASRAVGVMECMVSAALKFMSIHNFLTTVSITTIIVKMWKSLIVIYSGAMVALNVVCYSKKMVMV